MNRYKHVISLGSFCSVALEIERIGLRDSSGPFDWLICSFTGVIDCIKNDFENFLEYENLLQHQKDKQCYLDKKYKLNFFHDFSEFKDLRSQLPSVREKYKRRIERFKKNIEEPTLFLRYVSNQEELDYIEKNYDEIISLLRNKNDKCDLLLISRDDLVPKNLKVYQAEKDKGDSVARQFLEKNHELKEYLCTDIYDRNKRIANLEVYERSNKNKEIKKFRKKVLKMVKKLFNKQYTHEAIIENPFSS